MLGCTLAPDRPYSKYTVLFGHLDHAGTVSQDRLSLTRHLILEVCDGRAIGPTLVLQRRYELSDLPAEKTQSQSTCSLGPSRDRACQQRLPRASSHSANHQRVESTRGKADLAETFCYWTAGVSSGKVLLPDDFKGLFFQLRPYIMLASARVSV